MPTHTFEPAFAPAPPAMVAARLDAQVLHVWRMSRVPVMRREPLIRLLAAYVGVPATAIELVEGQHGKPALPDRLRHPASGARLEFNWSHSGDQAVAVVALGVQPGIDIERHAPRPNALGIARRFFDPLEAAALARIRGPERDAAFLELWCTKEAVLKAAGGGLSFGLDRLAFERNRQRWHLRKIDPGLGGDASAWQCLSFHAAGGYHAALAWRGGKRNILYLRPA